MSSNPIPGFAMGLLAASESPYGTVSAPAASQILEVIDAAIGQSELGVIRPKRDRVPGRGMTNGYIEGRQAPIDFTISGSMRVRADGNDAAYEHAVYLGAGIRGDAGASDYVYTLVSNPFDGTVDSFRGLSLYRCFGSPLAGSVNSLEAEQLEGGVVRSLSWRGGDQELIYTAQGQGRRKYTKGGLDSVTLADGSGTTLTHTAEESYRLQTGYYYCDGEIIRISAVGYGTTSSTIVRGELSSSASAHTSKPFQPYFPAWTALTQPPISEATSTVTIGSVATRCTSFQVDLTTGIDLLPPETGSKYSQGPKLLRTEVKARVGLIMKGDDVRLIGRAFQRVTTAVTIVQGTGTGGVVTFSLPYCELDPLTLPAPANDTIALELSLRCRDNGDGNNAMTITLT